MKVTREQTEVLLMEYAAGVLDEASALLAASYINVCPEARRYYRYCENVGGALMEHACEPVAMEAHSLKSVLGRLEDSCAEKKTGPRYADRLLSQAAKSAPAITATHQFMRA